MCSDPEFERFLLRARVSDAMFRVMTVHVALIYCIIPLVMGISSFASLMVEA